MMKTPHSVIDEMKKTKDAAISRRKLLGGFGLTALSLMTLHPLMNSTIVEAKGNPHLPGEIYIVQNDGEAGGDELVLALQSMTAGGIVVIPYGYRLICSSTVTLSLPALLVGFGASIQANHSKTSIVSIESDQVRLYGLHVSGSEANENAISIASNKGDIILHQITTAGCLIGVSTIRRVHHLVMEDCVLGSKVHGTVLRLVEQCIVKGCTLNDHPGSGATGIRVQGEEKTVTAITTANSSITITNHKFREGDSIRFYANGTVTMPAEIKVDTTYYVAGILGNDQFQIASYPGSPPLAFTGQDMGGTGTLKAIVCCKGLTITGNQLKNNRAGIYVLHTDDSLIENNDVSDGTCIQLENSWYNAICKNRVRNAMDLGINLHRNSSNNVVSDNQAHHCQNANIGLTGDVSVNIANNNYNIISNNVCTGARPLPGQYNGITGCGIELNGTGKHNLVSHNELHNNTRYGVRVTRGVLDTVIEGNQITRNNVGVATANDFTSITNNQITSNFAEGILISHPASSFLTISENAVKNNGGIGIKLGSGTRLSAIQGNVLSGNGSHFSPSSFNDNRIFHNILIDDGNKGSVRPTSHLFVGMVWYDTSIGKPVWYKGNGVWADSSGNTV